MGPTEPDGCRSAGPWDGRPIDTERLRLRPFRPGDAPVIACLLDDWEMVRSTSNIPFPYDRRAAEQFIAEVQRLTAERRALVFALEERLSGELVGCVGASLTEGAGEVGYWISHSHWDRGYATEAVRRCLGLIFALDGIEKAWAAILPENIGSRRVAEKAGLIFAGRRPGALPARNATAELDILELSRAGWLQQKAARPCLLVVAAALIDVDGRVLLAQRPRGKSMAGLWEFPGGKVALGESPEEALIRELDEELGVGVRQSCLAPLFFASHDYDRFHLLMPLYACRQWEGAVTSREGQALAWVWPNRLADYPMPPADLPLVALLRDWL